MKTLPYFRLLSLLLVGLFLVTWSCRREVEVPLPAQPKIEGKPSAATVGCMFVGAPGSATLTMRLDIYVVDKNGKQVGGLQKSDFSIPTALGRTYQLQNATSTALTSKTGGYSAMILLDQSGSVYGSYGTDPNDLRIAASKIFMDYLGSDDLVALSSFSGNRLGNSPNYSYNFTLHSRFSHETAAMKRSLDSLANSENGGTPLYEATTLATNYTYQYGPTSNKAVIVFTDGQASGDLDGCIANAQQKGIPLFTIGLTSGVDVAVLSRMATETCGAFFYAKDAEQLVTSFGTLGNLLRGKAQVYRTEWTIVRSSGKWSTGDVVTSSVKLAIPTGDPLDVPFWIKVK